MQGLTTLLILLATSATTVSAHGFVHKVWIGSKTFLGNTPNAEPTGSIVRQINSVDPVKGALNPFVTCGNDAQLAEDIADANPGDHMAFLWTGGDLSRWPHNTGPMLTYMASCGTTDCTTFNSSNAKWFKIAQDGRDSQGNWLQNRIFLQDNIAANVTLPSNIAPGAYIIRHEIIALHLATSLGGAEFYPSCSQIRVGGTGTGKPTSDELVSLPGAYSDKDPGILVPNVFDTPAPPYTFPGPPIAAFVAGSGSTPSSHASAPGSSPTSSPSSSGSSSTKGKSCKLKRASTTAPASKRAVEVKRPRHISRVMRDLHVAVGTLSGRH